MNGGKMKRNRNWCLSVSLATGVCWLFYVYGFISESGVPAKVPRAELQPGDIPFNRRTGTQVQHTVPEKLASSRNVLTKQEDCAGRYVYLHDLPDLFNQKLVDECDAFELWPTVCRDLENYGFGQPMENSEGVFSDSGWYRTHQFSLEVIWHHKMRDYKCRTMDSSQAQLIFVPFYAGIEVMPHYLGVSNLTHRDEVPYKLANWLTSRREWRRLDGHDHFMIGGTTTWDLRRMTDEENDWGNKLLFLEPVKNMTTLTIEASPYHGDDFGIPYPTYFHPSTDSEVRDWQARMRKMKRKSLFSFAGAPRPKQSNSIRSELMDQCRESEYCNLVECTKEGGKCKFPAIVMKMFQESHFCLQPSGDSYTRRSLFDSILGGCIPVLFHPYSAYTQYGWFFPENNSSYSVFIEEEFIKSKNVSIEAVLRNYSNLEIQVMREVVIGLIPKIVYGQPVNDMALKDAFDFSLDGVIERVRDYQRTLQAGEKKKIVGRRSGWVT